jgi:hypothetical protein
VSAALFLRTEKTQERAEGDDIRLGVAGSQLLDGVKKSSTHQSRMVCRGVATERRKYLFDEPLIAVNRSSLRATMVSHPSTKPN